MSVRSSARPYCLALLVAFAGPLRAAGTEVIFSLATTPTGSQVVAPYPADPTDIASWLSSGSPGTVFSQFSAPAGRQLRTVTLDMGDASNPAGGFSLSLVKAVTLEAGGIRLDLVAVLTGSANPATAGRYTYEVPPGISEGGDFGLLAQVAVGGGSYRWNYSDITSPRIGSGGSRGLVLLNRPLVSSNIGGTFDPGNVVIFVTDGDGLLFEVTADKVPAELTVARPKRFAPVLVGKEGRPREVAITNTGGSPLSSLSVTALGSTKRNFRVGSPSRNLLGAGEATVFEVAARPVRAGRVRGRIKVDCSAGFEIVGIRGRGVAPSAPSGPSEPSPPRNPGD
jgi:hypothetical protein